MDQEGITDRVRRRLAELGISASKASRNAGMSADLIRDMERKPDNSPTIKTITALAGSLKVSPEWLAFGTGDPDSPEQEAGDDTPAISSNGLRRHLAPGSLPEFDLRAGASYGGGYALPTQIADAHGRTYSAEAVRAQWAIPLDFLRHELRVSPLTTDVLPIDGTSMMPDLLPGDRVFVDRGHRDPRQGGIFAIREGDGIIIKHVELVRGSDPPRILCSSSNPTYKPFELILDGAEVEIIGRVAGRITRL